MRLEPFFFYFKKESKLLASDHLETRRGESLGRTEVTSYISCCNLEAKLFLKPRL